MIAGRTRCAWGVSMSIYAWLFAAFRRTVRPVGRKDRRDDLDRTRLAVDHGRAGGTRRRLNGHRRARQRVAEGQTSGERGVEHDFQSSDRDCGIGGSGAEPRCRSTCRGHRLGRNSSQIDICARCSCGTVEATYLRSHVTTSGCAVAQPYIAPSLLALERFRTPRRSACTSYGDNDDTRTAPSSLSKSVHRVQH